MTERMIQACPVCDRTHIRARKKTDDWYCSKCRKAFEKPVERLSMRQDPEPRIPCPYCGSTRTYITAGNSAKPYFRCIDCTQTFSITQERPMPPAGCSGPVRVVGARSVGGAAMASGTAITVESYRRTPSFEKGCSVRRNVARSGPRSLSS